MLNGGQGINCYEKWLQYQMLGTMRGQKLSIFMTPVVSDISDLFWYLYNTKMAVLQMEYLQMARIGKHSCQIKKFRHWVEFQPDRGLKGQKWPLWELPKLQK